MEKCKRPIENILQPVTKVIKKPESIAEVERVKLKAKDYEFVSTAEPKSTQTVSTSGEKTKLARPKLEERNAGLAKIPNAEFVVNYPASNDPFADEPRTMQQDDHTQQQHVQDHQSSSQRMGIPNYLLPQEMIMHPTCYRTLYDYEARDVDEVSFSDYDFIVGCTEVNQGWLTGTVHRTGNLGMLPANYVIALHSSTLSTHIGMSEEKHRYYGKDEVRYKELCERYVLQIGSGGNTMLHAVAEHMDEIHVEELVREGVNINVRNQYGETPLMKVAQSAGKGMDACLRIISFLIENGADVFIKNKSGFTFLIYWLRAKPTPTASQFHDLADLLIRKGRAELFNCYGEGTTDYFEYAQRYVVLDKATLSLLKAHGVPKKR